ncbi:MAG TPA: TerC family protein [Streptosporangiaceae bacterium]|nr:TerC family protein [Streptosporangiaceae bacterium]
MDVSLWGWGLTLGCLVTLIALDLIIVDRGGPRAFTLRQAGAWVAMYVSLAILFGVGIAVVQGGDTAGQFFAGYLTEYSLSIDNLFIFYVILGRFAVPRVHQHKVLLIGIAIALVLRGVFIAAGAAAIATFEWVFFIFGAFLIWTAISLLRGGDEPEEEKFTENLMLRWSKRLLPASDEYDGAKVLTRRNGKLLVTPLFIVMIAIGTTDLLFALDSIPAIFGLTQDPYLVFTSNAFALMGLRQLYFLLGGLVERLVYLDKGLSFILAFIGVKLVLEALHTYDVAWAPEVPIWMSLAVITGTMAVTTVASLLKARRASAEPAAEPAAEPGAEPGAESSAPMAETEADTGNGAAKERDGGVTAGGAISNPRRCDMRTYGE